MTRLTHASVPGADDVFTPGFCDLVVALHDRFAARVAGVRDGREVLQAAAAGGDLPTPAAIDSGDWTVCTTTPAAYAPLTADTSMTLFVEGSC